MEVLLSPQEEKAFRRALDLAKTAASEGEVPVGATLLLHDGAIFEGRNRAESGSPLRHAEIEAIETSLAARGRRGLSGSTLFVTAEPCLMCLGACVLARIGGLVYACDEPRFGGVALLQSLWREGRYPHRFPVARAGEPYAGEAAALMRGFFEKVRSGA